MGKYKTLFLGFVVGIAAIFIIRSCAMAPTEAHANPPPAAQCESVLFDNITAMQNAD